MDIKVASMSWLLETVLWWTLGYMCFFQFWFPHCVCPAVGLLGHMAALFPVFQGISTLFSIVAVLVCINMLSNINFLPRSKRLLISWLQSLSAVILELPKIKKSVTVSTVSLPICHEMMGPDAIILVFWMLSFKPTFHSPLSLSSIMTQQSHTWRKP